MSRLGWLVEVSKERTRQDEKWGEQNNSILEWVGILGEEFGEVCKAAIEHEILGNDTMDNLEEELIHVAAVAVSILECKERNGWE